MSREKPKDCFFPKKSHHGYFDLALQQRFYDKKQKLEFLHKNNMAEADPATPAHQKKVKELLRYCQEEKKKNPDFKYKGEYPD